MKKLSEASVVLTKYDVPHVVSSYHIAEAAIHFEYLGLDTIPGRGTVIMAEVDDFLYGYKPTKGSSESIEDIHDLIEVVKDGSKGYGKLMALNSLVKQGKLKVVFKGVRPRKKS